MFTLLAIGLLISWEVAAFTIEDRVQCNANLNVRATPSTSGTWLTTEPNGSRGIIIDGPQSANGYTWWKVKWDNGYTGWSVESFTLVTWYQLRIASSNPNSSVSISVSPSDFLGGGSGSTFFSRFYDSGTTVTLTAPSTASGNSFSKWTRNGADYSVNRTVEVSVLSDYTMTAVYVGAPPVTCTLTVASSNPNSGVGITGNQTDNNGNEGGITTFTRVFNKNAVVSFNAPTTANGNTFQKWQKDGMDWTTSTTASLTMDGNHTITVVYAAPTSQVPTIQTLPATSIGTSTATLNGKITSDGGAAILERRFSYGTTAACADGWTSAVTVSGNSFYYDLAEIPPGTYYFQAWARNSAGWGQSTAASFNTVSLPAPTITSVSPSSPVGSASSQPFYIMGANFVAGCNVILRDLMTGQTFANRTITTFDTTQIRIDPIFTTAAHLWSVEVQNPDSQTTGQFQFNVVASEMPTISVTTPAGGQSCTAGTAQPVTWSFSGTPPSPISYFAMNYSLNGGASWQQYGYFGSSSASSGTWVIPSTAISSQALVQIIAVNSSGMPMFWNQSAAFTISSSAGKPTAVPDASNLAPISGQSVSFTGINSLRATPSCAISSYAWNFGDGTTGSGANVDHVFPLSTSGTRCYRVDLSVTDCNGEQDTRSIWITVTGRALGTSPDQSFSADPVNLATGNYIYEHVDLKLPGKGTPFEFKRFYNSKAVEAPYAPLGSNWTHSYNLYLASGVSNSVIVTFADGHRETYATNGAGGFMSEPGVHHVLATNANGNFTLTTKEQLKYNFNAQNRLASVVDKNNNTLSLNYNASGNLTNITDTAGRAILLVYDVNNRITQIADPMGRTVKYTNNAAGDLISATDPNGNTTRYGYDSQHQMTQATDPRGNVFVRNVYDGQRRVVNSQKDALNYETGFAYDFVTRITTVTNALGKLSYHKHDEKLRVISITDELGNMQTFEYDDNNNRTKVIDKNGRATTYTYDAHGNVTSKSDPDAGVTGIQYNAQNNPIKRTNALTHLTAYEYNAAGNLTRTTNALDQVSSVGYDAGGLPIVLTNANGFRTTNTFDAQGNLLKVQDTLGNLTAFGYDSVGRKVAQTNANNKVTRYFYDNNDNLVRVVDPLNRTNAHFYDENNNRVVTIDARGAATTNTYDAKDRLISTRNAMGGLTLYEYDAMDRKTKVTDARLGITRFGYDAVGNLIALTNALNQVTRYTYDPNGNQTSVISPTSQVTTNIYDNLNRLVMTVDPAGNTNRFVYDPLGRKVQAIDHLNRTNHFTYDAIGRLTQTTDATGGTAKFAYDAVGNRLVTTDPKNQSVTNTYNALNRLTQTREAGGGLYQMTYDGAGNLTNRIDAKGQVTRYAYDGNNRRTSYQSGTPVTFSYDPNGNVSSMTDSLGTTTYQYDALNRVTSVTDAFGKTVSYGYDANGNRTSITYPGGKVVLYTYDSLNRMTAVTDWLGGVTSYSYDTAGNLSHTTNPDASTVRYAFDPANRLIGLTNSAPNGTPISSYRYTLDAVGNHSQVSQVEPLETTPVAGQFSYSYDVDNRLTSAEGEPHAHDANGNMTGLNATNLLTYDFEDRLIKTVFAGATNEYQYDGAGNRKMAVRSGVTTRYVLDLNSSLSQVLADTDGSGNVTAYYVYGLGLISQIKPDGTALYYHFDSRGSTIAMTDAQGVMVNAYSYDPFGRTRDALEFSENRFRYLGRHGIVDEGNGFSYIRARYYSVRRGRFVTKDPLTGTDGDPQSLNRYIYALNNPVRFIDVSGMSPLDSTGRSNQKGTSDAAHGALVNERLRRARLDEQLAWERYMLALEEQDITYEMWINIFTGIKDASASTLTFYASGGVAVIPKLLNQATTLAKVAGASPMATGLLKWASDTTGTLGSIYSGNIPGAVSGLFQQASTGAEYSGAPAWITRTLSTFSTVGGLINEPGATQGTFSAIESSFNFFSAPADIFNIWNP
jgi:RHS repeat-associated protein